MGNNAKLLIATLVGTLLLVVGISVFFSQSGSESAGAPVDPAILVAEATHTKGPENSPVTVVEFADFQCPYCAQRNPEVEAMLAQYPEVRFVYRHFPLISIHANAVASAQAAEAAHDQGKFWEMSDLLYSTQLNWESLRDPKDFFLGLARQLQLDEASFTKAYEDVATRDRIYKDLRLGEEVNVASTPTFFYNGEPLSGLAEVQARLASENFAPDSSAATATPSAN